MTHLLNVWTYYGPHSFRLMMALAIFKFLTALVSCATAITLLTLIPLLLKVKVRELFLRQNVLELNQEVRMMKMKKDASCHVRMLTQEIRKSLDKHTIVYTTAVELSRTLHLQNCAVWMLDGRRGKMNLTHELKRSSPGNFPICIPVDDLDVIEIRKRKGVRILRPDSALGMASSGGLGKPGPAAAIRMSILHASNFKGGSPEVVHETSYAILVLVLPNTESGDWSYHESEIVEVVADQVAIALSHASVLEESQMTREKLAQQNHVLRQDKRKAMMTSEARNSFRKVLSHGVRRPMHSILGLLSVFQEENMNSLQKLLVETMIRTGNMVSTLIEDAMEIRAKDSGNLSLDMRPFDEHSLVKDAWCLTRSLFAYQNTGVSTDISNRLPDLVIGDERRTFQVILNMVGHMLRASKDGSAATFRVLPENDVKFKSDDQETARVASSNAYVAAKFEIEVNGQGSHTDLASWSTNRRHVYDGNQETLSFAMSQKLVQIMQGNIWTPQNAHGNTKTMTLRLGFQLPVSCGIAALESGETKAERIKSSSVLRGLRVMPVEEDDMNRAVTKKLLDKLGCQVFAVPSGFECLRAVGSAGRSPIQVVILDLQISDMDGFEVVSKIHMNHGHRWPITIALTTSIEGNVWDRCLQIGITGLVKEPVVLQDIADELKRVLHRAKGGS